MQATKSQAHRHHGWTVRDQRRTVGLDGATSGCPAEHAPLWWRDDPRVAGSHLCGRHLLRAEKTGCQWNALSATGICPSSTAHDRFQAWVEDGFFLRFWQAGLAEYDSFNGIDWSWLAMDGAMTKAPLAGEKTGPNPTDRAKAGTKTLALGGGQRRAGGVCAWPARTKNDFKMLAETIWSLPVDRPAPTPAKPQHLCLDKGYDYEQVRWIAQAFGFVAHNPLTR